VIEVLELKSAFIRQDSSSVPAKESDYGGIEKPDSRPLRIAA
jgi:hypothetical protein